MTEKILVPILGESITEATISKWLKNKGDSINVDEALVELETDKVNLEVPSPVDGILTAINFKEGDTVEVGAVLGEISSGSAENKKVDVKSNDKEPKKESENVINFEKEKKQKPKIFEVEKKEEPLVLTKEEPSNQKTISQKVLSPAVRKIVEENNIDTSSVKGTGRSGQILNCLLYTSDAADE